MVKIQQIAVELEVPLPADLDRGVGRLIGQGARGKGQLRNDGEGGRGGRGHALGGELGLTDNDLQEVRVGRLCPVRLDRCHGLECAYAFTKCYAEKVTSNVSQRALVRPCVGELTSSTVLKWTKQGRTAFN